MCSSRPVSPKLAHEAVLANPPYSKAGRNIQYPTLNIQPMSRGELPSFYPSIKSSGGGSRGGNPELSGFPMQTRNCFPQHVTGGPPGVIQRRGVGRRNGEINKAGQATGAPGVNFITFMFFMVKCICIFLAWLMGILGLRGYAALIVSWGSVFRGENIKPVRRPALPGETKS